MMQEDLTQLRTQLEKQLPQEITERILHLVKVTGPMSPEQFDRFIAAFERLKGDHDNVRTQL